MKKLKVRTASKFFVTTFFCTAPVRAAKKFVQVVETE